MPMAPSDPLRVRDGVGLASGAAVCALATRPDIGEHASNQREQPRFHGEILSSQVTGTDAVSGVRTVSKRPCIVHFTHTNAV